MGSYDGKGGSRKGGNTQRGQAGRVRLEGLCAILAKWILPTRLETRTKESNTRASLVVEKPTGVMKVIGANFMQHRPTMIHW